MDLAGVQPCRNASDRPNAGFLRSPPSDSLKNHVDQADPAGIGCVPSVHTAVAPLGRQLTPEDWARVPGANWTSVRSETNPLAGHRSSRLVFLANAAIATSWSIATAKTNA